MESVRKQSDLPSSKRSSSYQVAKLLPRLNFGRERDLGQHEVPQAFETIIGWRRVPRMIDPPEPTLEMVSDARRGVLTDFLRSGTLLRASDYIGMVNPKTARISLDEIYDYLTRPLSAEVDNISDDKKSLRNLFYISLARDELPSFHFWKGLEDPDPFELEKAGREVNCEKAFEHNSPSPDTAAGIKDLKEESKARNNIDRSEHGSQAQMSLEMLAGPSKISLVSVEQRHRGEREQHQVHSEDEDETVRSKRENLDFLDAYSEKSGRGPLLAENNDLHEKHVHREILHLPIPTKAASVTQNGQERDKPDAGPQINAALGENKSAGSSILLQFRRGGLYLEDLSNKAFVLMAQYLVGNEEEDPAPDKDMRVFLDIKGPGLQDPVGTQISSTLASQRLYARTVKPFLTRPLFEFRVRSSSFDKSSPFVVKDKFNLKVVRAGIGYFHVFARWNEPSAVDTNSACFEEALDFLYSRPGSGETNPDMVTISVPEIGSYAVDRRLNLVVNARIQAIFSDITGLTSNTFSVPSHRQKPAEIYVCDAMDNYGQYPLIAEDVNQLAAAGTSPPSTLRPSSKNSEDFIADRERGEMTDPQQTQLQNRKDEETIENGGNAIIDANSVALEEAHSQSQSDLEGTKQSQQLRLDSIPKIDKCHDAAPAHISEDTGHAVKEMRVDPGNGKDTQTKSPDFVEPAPEQLIPVKDRDTLHYCNVCLRSVGKQNENGKTKHATGCGTTVSVFQHLTTQEAKAEREARKAADTTENPKQVAAATTTTRSKSTTTRKARAANTQDKPYKPPQQTENESSDHDHESLSATLPEDHLEDDGRRKPLKRKRKHDKAYRPPAGENEEDSDEEKLNPPKKKKKRHTKSPDPPGKNQATPDNKALDPGKNSSRALRSKTRVETAVAEEGEGQMPRKQVGRKRNGDMPADQARVTKKKKVKG